MHVLPSHENANPYSVDKMKAVYVDEELSESTNLRFQ